MDEIDKKLISNRGKITDVVHLNVRHYNVIRFHLILLYMIFNFVSLLYKLKKNLEVV